MLSVIKIKYFTFLAPIMIKDSPLNLVVQKVSILPEKVESLSDATGVDCVEFTRYGIDPAKPLQESDVYARKK